MAGIWVEEIDALAPEQKNSVKFKDGTEFTSTMLCDLIHLEGPRAWLITAAIFMRVHLLSPKKQLWKRYCLLLGTQPEDCAFTRMMGCIVKGSSSQKLSR